MMLARSHAGARDGAVCAEQMLPASAEDKAPSHVGMVGETFLLKKTPITQKLFCYSKDLFLYILISENQVL